MVTLDTLMLLVDTLRFKTLGYFTRFRSPTKVAYEVILPMALILLIRDEDGEATRNLICSRSAILL